MGVAIGACQREKGFYQAQICLLSFINDQLLHCKFVKKYLLSQTVNMVTFIVRRQPVTILVTALTNPNNLTNDLYIVCQRNQTSVLYF